MDSNGATSPHDFQHDIDAIGRSQQVPVILETVLLATSMGFAAVARVTESRWVTCRALDRIAFGLKPGDELEVESTLCHEVRMESSEIVIDDVRCDEIYHDHHTPMRYGFRSYISVPIHTSDGAFFGTLCAIDPEPRELKNDTVLGMFRLFAKLIGEALATDELLVRNARAIDEERHRAEVQERFIAILAHDLRSPLAMLDSGFRILRRKGLAEDAEQVANMMHGATGRTGNLIENLLEQARSRRDEGIVIERTPAEDLAGTLQQLVAELNAVTPDQTVRAEIDLPGGIDCDEPRIAQLVSNLLGNAVRYGASDKDIVLTAGLRDGALAISIANGGAPIPEEEVPRLFLPFQQVGKSASRRGLGLGLYIASEIAKGHGGSLEVANRDDAVVFTFTMPCAS